MRLSRPKTINPEARPSRVIERYFRANRYGTFGMQQVGADKVYQSGTYRYGFNGMEGDNEIKGTGNSYDFGARLYDPRLGKWLAIDPKASFYPSLSPYAYAGNSPIMAGDPNGEHIEVKTVENEDGSKTVFFTIHAKIIDLRTQSHPSDVNSAAVDAPKQVDLFSGSYTRMVSDGKGGLKTETVNIVVDMVVTPIFSTENIGKDDHVIGIVDDVGNFSGEYGGDVVGRAQVGGNIMFVERPSDAEVYAHEFGHWLGLGHEARGIMGTHKGMGTSVSSDELRTAFDRYTTPTLIGQTVKHRNAGREGMGTGDSKAEFKTSAKTWNLKYDASKITEATEKKSNPKVPPGQNVETPD